MCNIVYNTPFNTVGIGDPVPYGMNSFGSGDRFDMGPNFKQKLPKGKSYSQYNYKPSKATFKGPKPMPILGIHRMPPPPRMSKAPRFCAPPSPPRMSRFCAPPPPPPLIPLPKLTMTPFTKRSAGTVGKVSNLKLKPLIVKAKKK